MILDPFYRLIETSEFPLVRIIARIGLLKGPATTHPDAKHELQALGVEAIDKPLVCSGNVATAGAGISLPSI